MLVLAREYGYLPEATEDNKICPSNFPGLMSSLTTSWIYQIELIIINFLTYKFHLILQIHNKIYDLPTRTKQPVPI